MRMKLLPKFVISLGIVGLVLTVVISFFSYQSSKSSLEEMYAERVMFGGKSIADMLPAEDVRAILAENGENSEAYKRTAALFQKLKQDGEITFLSLVVPDEDSVTFYIDANVPEMGDNPADQIPYGSDILYTDAARDEADLQNYYLVWERYEENRGTDAPLVTDNAYGYNYTAVAPVLDEQGQAIAEVQYILDMGDVRSYLNGLLRTMGLIALGITAATLFLYMLFVRKTVVLPIERLAAFTEKITKMGQFRNQRIELRTGDEIEALGQSFNYMLEELERYLDNLAKVTAEKERIGAELGVAARIQSSMLPSCFPAFPKRREFDIFASMTPAKEVGGDFYDFFLTDDDHLALVIGDVSGKGVPASLFMVIAKTLLKNVAQTGLAPGTVLEQVNAQLCENNDAEMFVTVWLGILEISTGRLCCANAGHEYPALRRAGGKFELVKDKHGFVLAGMEGSRYREYELKLFSGDRLFVYTDGVTEATNDEEQLYGTGRLLSALDKQADAPLGALLPAVKADIDSFAGAVPQFDDITMLGLDYLGPSASA